MPVPCNTRRGVCFLLRSEKAFRVNVSVICMIAFESKPCYNSTQGSHPREVRKFDWGEWKPLESTHRRRRFFCFWRVGISIFGRHVTRQIAALLVEDSDSDATLLLNELTQAGYDVQSRTVDTAEDFLSALNAQPWDVILCDYRMPRFDGRAALKIFKEQQLDIPFIFVSGAISEEIAVGAMKAGAHDYVMKTNLKRLVPAVEREIREARERREKKVLRE